MKPHARRTPFRAVVAAGRRAEPSSRDQYVPVARAEGTVASRATRPRDLPSERKYVTMLRADLVRSSDLMYGLELEESLERLRPALEAMHIAVHRYDGIILDDLGDGVLAAFGAPVADDLHAVMACHASLDLLRRIKALGDPAFRVRIGIHSGLVVAGLSEADFRRMYSIRGPSLILAERLQAAAMPDQALASDACQKLAQGYIRFGSPEERSLKGFPRPVTVGMDRGAGGARH
jgi:class 3 adenylate cyclase